MNAHTIAATEASDRAQFFVFRAPSQEELERDLLRLAYTGKSRYAPRAARKALRKARLADGTLKNPRKHIDHLPAAVGATKAPKWQLAEARRIRPQNLADYSPRVLPPQPYGHRTKNPAVKSREAFDRAWLDFIKTQDQENLTPADRQERDRIAARLAAPAAVEKNVMRPWSGSFRQERKGKVSKHKPVDHWGSLVARMKTWLLSPQDERQLWAQFVDTRDPEVGNRLVQSCARKCWFLASRSPKQEKWETFMGLYLEVGKILEQCQFDPDGGARLPTYVGKILGLRAATVRSKIRGKESQLESPSVDEDGDSVVIEEAEEEADANAERLEALLAGDLGAVNRQIVEKMLEDKTQAEIAAELGMTQPAVSQRLKKLGGVFIKSPARIV